MVGELNATSIVSPALIGKKGKLPKHKINEERQELDDQPYRQYIEEYREDLLEGMIYMLGDHPRED